MGAEVLPVASIGQVIGFVRGLLRENRGELFAVVAAHTLAAACGLAVPYFLGDLAQGAADGDADPGTALLVIGVLFTAQSAMTWIALHLSARLAERLLARIREDFAAAIFRIPLALAERAGIGELVARSTRDISALNGTFRQAAPSIFTAVVTCALTLGALALLGPVLMVPCLLAFPLLWFPTRWYLRRAPAGYLRENASYAGIVTGLSESVQGARTTEALRLEQARLDRTREDLSRSAEAERHTLFLRSVWFPFVGAAWVVPTAATLVIGGYLYANGSATLAQTTAAALYVQQLSDPMDRLTTWTNQLQAGAASLARLLGVTRWSGPRKAAEVPSAGVPVHGGTGGRVVVDGVDFAYRDGQRVLRDISLDVAPGERLALVGASGAGKSTLGLLLVGAHVPRAGTVTIDGTAVGTLNAQELGRTVSLVAQSSHVFDGTLRDNLTVAGGGTRDAELHAALAAVGASWVEDLSRGLDTVVGSGPEALTPGRAQQVALARIILADPKVLVLDEATSCFDPVAASRLEHSLSAALEGRTVIYIAHRLHTARDADRVALLADGRVVESGSHAELLATGGAYAALWTTWQGGSGSAQPEIVVPPERAEHPEHPESHREDLVQ
ncbi:ABC transporter ATP-binding protein [Embleya sp. NPDC001921]